MIILGENVYNGLRFNVVQEDGCLRVYSPDKAAYQNLPDALDAQADVPLFDMPGTTSLIQIEMMLCDGMGIPRPGFDELPVGPGDNLHQPRDPAALAARVPTPPPEPDEADLPPPLADPDVASDASETTAG